MYTIDRGDVGGEDFAPLAKTISAIKAGQGRSRVSHARGSGWAYAQLQSAQENVRASAA
jgi:hypothetical protein